MTKPIMRVALTHIKDILNPGDQRRMEMPGFDAEFVDFPHYIMKITDRIWHDRQVEAIYDYYTSDCPIHTLGGDIVGAAQLSVTPMIRLKAFLTDALTVIMSFGHTMGKVIFILHILLAVR